MNNKAKIELHDNYMDGDTVILSRELNLDPVKVGKMVSELIETQMMFDNDLELRITVSKDKEYE